MADASHPPTGTARGAAREERRDVVTGYIRRVCRLKERGGKAGEYGNILQYSMTLMASAMLQRNANHCSVALAGAE